MSYDACACHTFALACLDLYSCDMVLRACRHWEYEVSSLEVLSVEVSEDSSAVVLAAVEVCNCKVLGARRFQMVKVTLSLLLMILLTVFAQTCRQEQELALCCVESTSHITLATLCIGGSLKSRSVS